MTTESRPGTDTRSLSERLVHTLARAEAQGIDTTRQKLAIEKRIVNLERRTAQRSA